MSTTENLNQYQLKIIYLASPFFNPEQIDREERVCNKLRSLGYVVIRPKELGIIPKGASLELRKAVMKMDLDSINKADAVFGITNGKDIGTSLELGYAIAKEIPVIYFAEGFEGNFNVMLAATGSAVTRLDDITREFIDKSIELAHQGKIYQPYEGNVE